MNLLYDKQLLNIVPFQSTKHSKKELSVDNIKTIGSVYCPTCRNENCVDISTNKKTRLSDCKKREACCHVLKIPFKGQKPTIMLFGGDGTHCLHESRLRKAISFFVEFSPPITVSRTEKGLERVQIRKKRILFLLADDLSNILIFQIILFNFSLQLTYTQLTQNHHDLLGLQRRNPVDSRFWTRLCYYCSK